MKHTIPKCKKCGKSNRFSIPVLGHIICKPCMLKWIQINGNDIKLLKEVYDGEMGNN